MTRTLDLPVLHAPPLRLEPLLRHHAAELFPLLADARLYRWLDYGPPASLAHLESVYTRLEARHSTDGREGWLNWLVRHEARGVVGYVQATVLPAAADAATTFPRAWIAYVIGHAHQGQGLGLAATRCMARYLVQGAGEGPASGDGAGLGVDLGAGAGLGVGELIASVEADNAASVALLCRLGLQPAGAAELQRLLADGTLGEAPGASERLYIGRAADLVLDPRA